MASAATRRIQRELAELMAQPVEGVTVIPDENNIQSWQVFIQGPPKTAYANGKFVLSVEFSHDFPFKAPTVSVGGVLTNARDIEGGVLLQMKFKTRMYHPNIDSEGNLCMGILKVEQWKPSTKMNSLLIAIYDLIENPNPDDPLESSIISAIPSDKRGTDVETGAPADVHWQAEQYRSDRKAFDKKAADYTRQYAS
ncbi:MAG: hypothetical protein TREMPRED_006027 [Tremellales sp. Tagirdzhanova-0007]|nr:MAG: hypothetical protein TREMPRED_006027 [Tremellales sp. Tagirdzhanova-0007]